MSPVYPQGTFYKRNKMVTLDIKTTICPKCGKDELRIAKDVYNPKAILGTCLICGFEKVLSEYEQLRLLCIYSARQIGIAGTARKYNMPISTVHKYARGESCNIYQHDHDFRVKVATEAITSDNIYGTAKKYGIARSNVQLWIRKYLKATF